MESYLPYYHGSTNQLIVEWIGIVLAIVFGITMFCQGHFILHGKNGYRHSEREKQKMKDARAQVEKALKGKMKDDEKREFYKGLRERIKQLRMEHLFEEPCPLYEPEDDDK